MVKVHLHPAKAQSIKGKIRFRNLAVWTGLIRNIYNRKKLAFAILRCERTLTENVPEEVSLLHSLDTNIHTVTVPVWVKFYHCTNCDGLFWRRENRFCIHSVHQSVTIDIMLKL